MSYSGSYLVHHVNLPWYYSRNRLAPDPSTPIDRWAQADDTRDLEELIDFLKQMASGAHFDRLVEPFSGLGSGALAARYMGLSYHGVELDRQRAALASAKAFLSVDDVSRVPRKTHSLVRRYIEVFDAQNKESLAHAAQATLLKLEVEKGSQFQAISTMIDDMAAIPRPVRGQIVVGDFRAWSNQPLKIGGRTIHNICPPFPRPTFKTDIPKFLEPTGQPIACDSAHSFIDLCDGLNDWLARCMSADDLVLAEYFNYRRDFDSCAAIVNILSKHCSNISVMITMVRDLEGTIRRFRSGYSGFVIGYQHNELRPFLTPNPR
jgi:hypothetical protein